MLRKLQQKTGVFRMKNHSRSIQAFTLMELALVIVVVGLLAGAVVVGFQVMDAAKIRNSVSKIEEYNNAVNSFRDQYFGWPGDITNAGSLWPECDATPTNCNGNGNSIIDSLNESYRAWQELTLAELVGGSYTGTSSGGQSVLGTNVPNLPIDGIGISLTYADSTWATFYIGSLVTNKTNIMIIGKPTTNNLTTTAGVLTSYAQEIDQKIDDGFPSSGTITSNNAGGCVTAAVPPKYNTATSTAKCALVIQLHQ